MLSLGLPLLTPSSLHELVRFHKSWLLLLDIRACPKLLMDDHITPVGALNRRPGFMGGHALAECFVKCKVLSHIWIGHVPLVAKKECGTTRIVEEASL
jgi:hypothetical protein